MHPLITRQLNEEIRRFAETLPGVRDHKYGFSGEDGCGKMVTLTVAEFDRQGGAWLDGHKPADFQPDLLRPEPPCSSWTATSSRASK